MAGGAVAVKRTTAIELEATTAKPTVNIPIRPSLSS
jgi:hypothetical protein